MRTPLLVVMMAFATLPLAAVAPSAEAVGICSELKDWYCQDYLVCVGYRWDSRGFVCTGYGVRDPCSYHCPPIYALP